MGAVVTPAMLPSGSSALYGFVGAPDVAVGYRQGFGVWELDARAAFNIFEVSATAELGFKFPAYRTEKLQLAPVAALGVKFNSGSRYFDAVNFRSIALRPKLGLYTTYAFSDIVSGLVQLEVPLAIALTAPGYQLTPLLGAGAEIHLGSNLSLLISAHVGFDVTREPYELPVTRAAWAARFGIGYRLF